MHATTPSYTPKDDQIFKALPWQIKVWEDTSQFVLLTGSAGGGKSRICAEKIHALACYYKNYSGLIVRKTREALTNSTILYFNTVVLKDKPWVKHCPSMSRWEYPNGSKIFYGGIADEKQRQKIRSIGGMGNLDGIWAEEATALTNDDFNELMARLRGTAAPWTQFILSTNPQQKHHWINRRLIDGKMASVHFSRESDNPYNPANYKDILLQIDGVRGLRLREGIWTTSEGAVYPEWRQDKHVIDPFPVPKTWRKFCTIDFGYVAPFVCLWVAQDPETKKLYIYRELYQTKLLVEDAAKIILRKSQDGIETIEATVADHDAEDRATLERHGIKTKLAFKDLSPGIEAMRSRIRANGLYYFTNALIKEDAELAKLYKPTSFIREITDYCYNPNQMEGKEVKEEPFKKDDHALDAMRYLICYIDEVGKDSSMSFGDMVALNKDLNKEYKRPRYSQF